jgi:hypothetical protein
MGAALESSIVGPDVVASAVDIARLTLQSHDIAYEVEADDRLAIHYGSARLSVLIRRTGESAVIRMSACVLDEVAVQGDEELRFLRSLNERNRTLSYGKFFYVARQGEIHVEYEILADDVQRSEFMNALTTVARLADDHDEILLRELGQGRRVGDRG